MPLTRALLAASVTAPAGRKVAAPTGGLFAGGSTILAPLGLLEAPSLHPLAGSWPPRLAGCRWQHGPRTPWPAGSVVTAPAGRKLAAPRLAGCRWQHNPRTPWPAGSSVIAPAGRKAGRPDWRAAGGSTVLAPLGLLAAPSPHPLAGSWPLPDWRAAGGSTILAPLGLLAAPSLHPLAGSWPPRLAGCRWQHGPRTRWPAGTFRHRTRWREVAATDMHCRTPGRAHSSCSLAAHAAAVEGRRSARLMA